MESTSRVQSSRSVRSIKVLKVSRRPSIHSTNSISKKNPRIHTSCSVREFDRSFLSSAKSNRVNQSTLQDVHTLSIKKLNTNVFDMKQLTDKLIFENSQKFKHKKRGLCASCGRCSPLCKLLALIGLLLLASIITAIAVTSTLTAAGTTTTTTTTSTTATTTTVTSTTTSTTSSTTTTTTSTTSSTTTTTVSTSTSTTSSTTSTTTTATTTSATTATTTSVTTATTTTATTTTTEFACSPACEPEQTCIEEVCLNVGYLSCAMTWSRDGDGDIVVATPTGNTIHYQNKGPSNQTDFGKLDRDDKKRGPENVFWTKNSTGPPPSGTYYVCFEPFSFPLIIVSINPVTVTYRIIFPSGTIIVLSRRFTSSQRNSYNCGPSSNTLVGSFTYP